MNLNTSRVTGIDGDYIIIYEKKKKNRTCYWACIDILLGQWTYLFLVQYLPGFALLLIRAPGQSCTHVLVFVISYNYQNVKNLRITRSCLQVRH